MKIEEALIILNRAIATLRSRGFELFVKVLSPGSVGGTPCRQVRGLNPGIDWDAGKFFIETDAPLTALTPDDVAAIHESARGGQSWHAFQSYKRQELRIKELKAELSSAKSLLKDSLQLSHKLGFLQCAISAKRDDLFAEVDSSAYTRDRDCDLAQFVRLG